MDDGVPTGDDMRAAREAATDGAAVSGAIRAAMSERRARLTALEDVSRRRGGGDVAVSGEVRFIARTGGTD